nr:MAG TPA: hypothetical protein [Caudoviricetes sp.]DAQ84813.1 MAG TPA: hypothetical protein [Caudoviricetes sp.]
MCGRRISTARSLNDAARAKPVLTLGRFICVSKR